MLTLVSDRKCFLLMPQSLKLFARILGTKWGVYFKTASFHDMTCDARQNAFFRLASPPLTSLPRKATTHMGAEKRAQPELRRSHIHRDPTESSKARGSAKGRSLQISTYHILNLIFEFDSGVCIYPLNFAAPICRILNGSHCYAHAMR